MADNVTVNGNSVATDEIAGVDYQRVKPVHGVDGVAVDASATSPFPVLEPGTFAYAAGTAPVTVTVPAGLRLKRVAVLPGGGTATVQIGAGPTITVPADGEFSEEIPGSSIAPAVVIGGSVGSYYVAWA